jgi:hypothetical protein
MKSQRERKERRYTTYNDVSNGIRTHDPSVRAGTNSSCLNRAATVIGKYSAYYSQRIFKKLPTQKEICSVYIFPKRTCRIVGQPLTSFKTIKILFLCCYIVVLSEVANFPEVHATSLFIKETKNRIYANSKLP